MPAQSGITKLTWLLLGVAVLPSLATAQVVAEPASNLTLQAEIAVGGDFMGIGFGSLWEPSGGKLVRVSGADNSIQAKIDVSGSCRGVGIGEDAVWFPSCGNQALYKIDPKTNTVVGSVPLALSGSEASIAVGAGSVWVVIDSAAGASSSIVRVDVGTLQVTATIPLSTPGAGVAFDSGSAWITSPEGNKVIRIEADSNKVTEIPSGDGPRFISAGEGGVWILNQGDGNVQRIDPKSGQIVATIEANLAGFGGDISAAEGGVYMTMPGVPVAKIDPATNKIVRRFEGYGFGDALRTGLGSVWVSGGKLHRIQLP